MKFFKNLTRSETGVFTSSSINFSEKIQVYPRQYLLFCLLLLVLTCRAAAKGQTGSAAQRCRSTCIGSVCYAAGRLVFQLSSYTSRNWPGDSITLRSRFVSNSL